MGGNKTLTLGSLFDGSGSFPFGGILAGIEPKWNSEIEPFPVLVTHKRLPQVKHYGDVSGISGADLEPVDIITFGSPCFPEGTLVLTEEGYIPIEEVEVGMNVLTHLGRWKTVTASGAKFGETVILKGNHYGLECTPNHPIYSSGERRYYPRLDNGKRGNQILLTDEKTWVPAGKMEGRLWAVPNSVDVLPVTSPVYSGSWKQKAMPPLSDDLFYFIGRWLGDGWVCNGQRAGRPEGQTQGKIYLCDSEDKVRFTFNGWDGRSYDGESRSAGVYRTDIEGYTDARFVKVGKHLCYIDEESLVTEKATGEKHPEAEWLVKVLRAKEA